MNGSGLYAYYRAGRAHILAHTELMKIFMKVAISITLETELGLPEIVYHFDESVFLFSDPHEMT